MKIPIQLDSASVLAQETAIHVELCTTPPLFFRHTEVPVTVSRGDLKFQSRNSAANEASRCAPFANHLPPDELTANSWRHARCIEQDPYIANHCFECGATRIERPEIFQFVGSSSTAALSACSTSPNPMPTSGQT